MIFLPDTLWNPRSLLGGGSRVLVDWWEFLHLLKRAVVPRALPPVAVLAERSVIAPATPVCNIATVPGSSAVSPREGSPFRFRVLRSKSATTMRRTMPATPPTTPPTTLPVGTGEASELSAGLSPANVGKPPGPVPVGSPLPPPPPPPPRPPPKPPT